MIVTHIKDEALAYYKNAHPRFATAFAALEKLIAENAPVGKYEIDGTNIFAMVQEYETQPMAQKKFEVHHAYIDIQYIDKGRERMGFESLDRLTPMGNDKPDAKFFFVNDGFDSANLTDGELAVFFPGEPHAPGAAVDDVPSPVRKIVVKVLA